MVRITRKVNKFLIKDIFYRIIHRTQAEKNRAFIAKDFNKSFHELHPYLDILVKANFIEIVPVVFNCFGEHGKWRKKTIGFRLRRKREEK